MGKNPFWTVIGLAIGLAGLTQVHAGRPFATDDAGIVQTGSFEIETALDYWEGSSTVGAELRYGIGPRLDLGIRSGRCLAPHGEHSFHNPQFSMKVGVVPDLLSATFDAAFADPVYALNAVLSHGFGPLGFDANLGLEAVGASTEYNMTWGLCLHSAIKRVGFGAELCGTHEQTSWWQAGLSVTITDWLTLDSGIGSDFSDPRQFTATSGFWLAFPITQPESKGE